MRKLSFIIMSVFIVFGATTRANDFVRLTQLRLDNGYSCQNAKVHLNDLVNNNPIEYNLVGHERLKLYCEELHRDNDTVDLAFLQYAEQSHKLARQAYAWIKKSSAFSLPQLNLIESELNHLFSQGLNQNLSAEKNAARPSLIIRRFSIQDVLTGREVGASYGIQIDIQFNL